MGLSIHYSGTIKSTGLITPMVDEVQDVCKALEWTYHIFDDKNFKGICFSPPECEPVFLTFHNGLELASPVLWQLKLEPITTISTKTQFAGIEVHVTLLKLLKHLKARYFTTFEMMDEGGYWETGDYEVLRKQFGRYNFILSAVYDAVSKMEKVEGETAGGLADRLEQALGKKWEELKDKPEEDTDQQLAPGNG